MLGVWIDPVIAQEMMIFDMVFSTPPFIAGRVARLCPHRQRLEI
jgi:hypothetical protein